MYTITDEDIKIIHNFKNANDIIDDKIKKAIGGGESFNFEIDPTKNKIYIFGTPAHQKILEADVELIALSLEEKDTSGWVWGYGVNNWPAAKIAKSSIEALIPDKLKEWKKDKFEIKPEYTVLIMAFVQKHCGYEFVTSINVTKLEYNSQIIGLRNIRWFEVDHKKLIYDTIQHLEKQLKDKK